VKNGVIVLQDDVQLVDGRFYVIGRQDKSESYRGVIRKTPAELMEGLDPDLYKIVLDHQPVEYREEALAGADLVLSGHTHGGQFFPFNQMGVLTGEYDRSYGHEQRDHTDFIVTSGISDWSLIFKTGCRSEYVVIDIHGTA
jgi:predicted MPP superfamily phosphohydrolase